MNRKLTDRIFGIAGVILSAFFLPVLICVAFVGTNMDYWEAVKVSTRLPNPALLVIAVMGLAVCIFLFRKFGRIEFSPKTNLIADGVLAGLFLLLYFINVRIAREIAFHLPTDYMLVGSLAYKIAKRESLDYFFYLSIYPNNIPIAYILGRLYRKAMELQDYPYIYDFIWLQVNCLLISAAGFFSCLTVKKLTKKLLPVAAAFGLYFALVGMSAWKIAPYTDTYALLFPVLCIYLWLCFRDAGHAWSRYLFLLLSILAGMTGGFIKPSVYVVVLALLGWEFVCFLADYRQRWKYLLPALLLTAALAWGAGAYRDHLIKEIGLDFNEELEAGWQHYFLMGLNEATTGAYNSEDALFGEFQTSREDRIHEELARAAARLKDRGLWGSLYFYLRKLVMTFNDGTFGWNMEIYIYDYYPGDMAGNTALTQRLRSIYWGNELNYDVGGYKTLCQLVWIFAMLGIPGICLAEEKTREKYGFLIVCFLGIFFYQMLFEARARYLFCFLPAILPMAACGIQHYARRLDAALQRRKGGQQQSRELMQDHTRAAS